MTEEHGFGYGPDGHLSVEVVSDLVEGLLNEDQQSSVESHLNRCASCQETMAALQQVQELLRTAEPVGPMPVSVARRIDDALAREAATWSPAARSASPTVASAAADGPAAWSAGPSPYGEQSGGNLASLADARARRNRRRGRLASIAAGVAVLAVGGAVAAVSLNGGSSGGPTNPAPGNSLPPNAAYVEHITGSGTAYTPNDLSDQVHALLAADGVSGWTAPAGTALASPLAAAPAPPPCVDEGIKKASESVGTKPLAVDKGTADGEPVWVVVLPARAEANPGDPASVAVYVLDGDPTCPATPPRVKANVAVSR